MSSRFTCSKGQSCKLNPSGLALEFMVSMTIILHVLVQHFLANLNSSFFLLIMLVVFNFVDDEKIKQCVLSPGSVESPCKALRKYQCFGLRPEIMI